MLRWTQPSAIIPGGPVAEAQGTRDPVIVLAGGLGTRLRALDATRPKPMVLVEGQPFLYWLMKRLHAQGFRRFLLSTGYLAEQIEAHPWTKDFPDCAVSCHKESTPLGTGGATARIFAEARLQRAWVVNGDTLLSADLPSDGAQEEAFYTALAQGDVFDAEPNLHGDGTMVTRVASGGLFFDAGAVWARKEAFVGGSTAVPCALHDLLRGAMARRKVGCRLISSDCYDIGTPERFQRFGKYLTSGPQWLANSSL